jgi:hypothetical protein
VRVLAVAQGLDLVEGQLQLLGEGAGLVLLVELVSQLAIAES